MRLSVTKGGQACTVKLARPSQAAIVDAGRWRDFIDFSEDPLVVVLASDEYNEDDYISDYDAFVRWDADLEPVTSVPHLDLHRSEEAVGAQIGLAMRRVVRSGALISGPELTVLERCFAAYCQTGQMLGVGNSLDALTIALRTFGVGPSSLPAHQSGHL